ncbi:hypothetical protein POM88_023970 [Heracleum sosnowskyi]|uniref:Ubiquitin-like protease family profile domain-containing protein n=1 Tax=Heracleum sosnowskyi TaxID=360622 RepID=A0AAD8MQZ1_9APIA|nr:hypothetical protein POM88_023970 [Heracleum sosnowskyi]
MDRSSRGHISTLNQPRRSPRLQPLSLPTVSISEPFDLIESEEVVQSEEIMEEGYESQDKDQSSDDSEKTPPRGAGKDQPAPTKTKSRRKTTEKEVGEDQPAPTKTKSKRKTTEKEVGEDEPPPKKTKWKRKTTQQMSQQEGQNETTKRRKPNVKYPKKTKKDFYTGVDDDEEIQAAKQLNRAKEHVKIRNSPRLLSEMLYCLTEEQKQWAKDNGFGQLLAFDLELLPGPFAYNVLQIFEHNSVSLRLSNGQIDIREEDVSDVLGLPNGGHSIMLGSVEKYKTTIDEWNSQFSKPDQITTIQVVEKMKEPGLSNYNWAEYLLNSLVAAVQSWNCSQSLFFNGSLIFLTLLYVDRVRHKGIKLVERMTPSYKGWTEEKLRERQAIELYYGKFGVGSILPPLRDVPATTREKSRKYVADDNAQDWNDYDNYEQGQCDYVHDNDTEQHHFESSQKNFNDRNNYNCDEGWAPWNNVVHQSNLAVWEKEGDQNDYAEDFEEQIDYAEDTEEQTEHEKGKMDEVEELRLRAQELILAKAQFDKDLVEVKEKFGDNADLLSIENENVCEIAAEFELRPQDIEHLEIIEYLNSEQARIDMPDLFGIEEIPLVEKPQNFIPSFSLGIEDNIISEDIDKVQTTDKDMLDDDDYITPKPEVRERSTRILKVGRYAKSPYIERVIDMSAKYTNQDLAMWLYMIRKNNILDNIFSWNGLTCIREHLQTLKMKTCLFYSVIDTWSIILNDNENYKADESPLRLFCPIGSLYSGLNVDLSKTATYQYFAQNMDWTLKKYKRKLENVDMVFFPINKYEHFYVICYNLKKEACDLIDNIKRECDPKQYYGKTANTLHSHFTRYMEENGLLNLSKRIRKLKQSYLKMSWQTYKLLETYKGDTKSWETGFHEEGRSQDNQICRLKVKYNNAILSSNLNEKKDGVVTQAKQLFNEATQKKFMNFIAQASASRNKGSNMTSNSAKKKTVTFATNLARNFDEAEA